MIDAFAIRTSRVNPSGTPTKWKGTRFEQQAQVLPAGKGRYVDAAAATDSKTETITNKEGKLVKETVYFPTDFKDVMFPMEMARPEIINATEKAMALEVFDEIGIARDWRAGGDPMILGRILHPKRNSAAATFFIAWQVPLGRW